MKKLLGLLFTVISVSVAFADEPTEVKNKIESVTVFLDGAEVINTAEIKMTAGQKQQYVFSGLSNKMRPGTVNVTATGDVSIVSIVERINYLKEAEVSPKIKLLQDSLEILTHQTAMIANERSAYYSEQQLITNNQNLSGANTGVLVAEIIKAADFIRVRMLEINNKLTALQEKETKVWEKYNRVSNQLAEMNAQFNQYNSEVVITLSAHSATTSNVKLRYLVTSAGWASTYDITVEDISKPIYLNYRANVYNNTGIDWNDVKVKLSTADPLQGISKPILEKWVLNYDEYKFYGYDNYWNSNNIYDDGNMDKKFEIAPSVMNQEEIPSMPNQQLWKDNQLYQAIEVSLVTTTFEIKEPYSIPADSKPYLIDVKTEELPAMYSYYSAPKLDESAFLLGRVTGWEDLNLVEGDANIYFGDTYLGKSHIYTENMEDTLDLSLGRDDKIMVTREKLKEFSSKQFFGTTEKETYTYEISIKNNRDRDIDVEVQDQLPVSEIEDIEIEATEISGASDDINTGILTWNMKIKVGETKKITLSYSIKHPKGQDIKIEQNKVRYSPKF